jgi:tetratricopeptide (TPR) repeat protein
LFEKALGTESQNLIESLSSLAEVCRFQGKYDDAEQLYRRALTIQEKSFGAGHPSVATSLENLMIIFTDLGNYPEAERMRERVRAIRSGFAP